MAIPKYLTSQHIDRAARIVDSKGIPKGRESDRYDLLLGNKFYPPKLIISLAAEVARGQQWNKFNAVEAVNYFTSRNYLIFDKNTGWPLTIDDALIGDDESVFPEGREKYRMHRSLERDHKIVRKAKERRLREVGELRCDACKFSFRDMYGNIGASFIEAHHIIPVSKIEGKTKTKISDLALVCANCHRMLHRANPQISVAVLKGIIKKH